MKRANISFKKNYTAEEDVLADEFVAAEDRAPEDRAPEDRKPFLKHERHERIKLVSKPKEMKTPPKKEQ